MKTLEFKKVEKFSSYICALEDGSQISLVLEFINIESPKVGDKLLINSALLDKSSKLYSQPYSFTLTNELTAKEIKEQKPLDFAAIKLNNKFYSLKRIYG